MRPTSYLMTAVFLSGLPLMLHSSESARPQALEEKTREVAGTFDTFPHAYKKPRLGEVEWKRKLGSQAYKDYKVQKGDTLSKISKKLFNTYEYWPKIWESNQDLTNPHLIEPGMVLRYVNPNRSVASSLEKVKVAVPKNEELGETRAEGVELLKKFRPYMFVKENEDKVLGKITGAFSPWHTLNLMDDLYITMDSTKGIKTGDLFSVTRKIRDIPSRGVLRFLVGEVKVEWVSGTKIKASVVSQFQKIFRGDSIEPLFGPIDFQQIEPVERKIQLEVLYGESKQKKIFGLGDIVLLQQGYDEGVMPGQRYRVYESTDERTGESEGILPDYKAEIHILQASKLASVAYVLQSERPIFVGDRALPAKAFPDKTVIQWEKRKMIEVP